MKSAPSIQPLNALPPVHPELTTGSIASKVLLKLLSSIQISEARVGVVGARDDQVVAEVADCVEAKISMRIRAVDRRDVGELRNHAGLPTIL